MPYGEQSFNVALVLLTHEELQRAQIAAIELDTSVVTSQRIVAAVIMKHEAVSVYSSHSERC